MDVTLPLDLAPVPKREPTLPSPKSAQTIDAYDRDFRRYERWCDSADRVLFAGSSVAAYLTHLATSPPEAEDHKERIADAARAVIPEAHAYSTIRRRLVGIAHGFAKERVRCESRQPLDPRSHPDVADVLKRVQAEMDRVDDGEDLITARPVTPITPASPDDVRSVVAPLVGSFDHRGDALRAARDRAMLLLFFCGALTRGELRNLRVSDVTIANDGMVLTVNRSEFQSRARKVPIARGVDPATCPVAALEDYFGLARFAAATCFIFVAIEGSRGFIAPDARPLHVRRFAQIVDKRVQNVGLDPAAFTALGFRTGMAVQIHYAGGTIADVIAQTGHRSTRQVKEILNAGASWAPRSASLRGL